nr:RNA-directed DNA polymerase, eukaryota [Tanacetum cinerariifolium]
MNMGSRMNLDQIILSGNGFRMNIEWEWVRAGYNSRKLRVFLCNISKDKIDNFDIRLQANIATFQRPPVNGNNLHVKKNVGTNSNASNKDSRNPGLGKSYVHVVKDISQNGLKENELTPAIVLDDECLNCKDMSVSEFLEEYDEEDLSDDGSRDVDSKKKNVETCGDDSDLEEVQETVFEEKVESNHNVDENSSGLKENHSEDPFGFTPNEESDTLDMNKEDNSSKIGHTGFSGGILCVWDCNSFRKVNVTVSDSFILIRDIVKENYKRELEAVEMIIDKGEGNDDIVNTRMGISKSLQDIDKRQAMELAQKAKVQWSIEGDENSKFFHGILNKKWSQLNIRGIMIDGVWTENLIMVKNEFFHHFSRRFDKPANKRVQVDMMFPKSIPLEQQSELELEIYKKELKRRFWKIIESDVFEVVKQFFTRGKFPKGCNSCFIALIPKIPDANLVKDFRPISLIGSLYKIIAKF